MTKFLADENIGSSSVDFLKDQGLDVVWALREYPGIPDTIILQKANLQNRIVLTADKDFGYLAIVDKLPHKGIVLLRLKSKWPQDQVAAIAKILSSAYIHKIANNFTVVTETKIRIRPPRKSALIG